MRGIMSGCYPTYYYGIIDGISHPMRLSGRRSVHCLSGVAAFAKNAATGVIRREQPVGINFEAEHQIYQEDAVLEYPQSGERPSYMIRQQTVSGHHVASADPGPARMRKSPWHEVSVGRRAEGRVLAARTCRADRRRRAGSLMRCRWCGSVHMSSAVPTCRWGLGKTARL